MTIEECLSIIPFLYCFYLLTFIADILCKYVLKLKLLSILKKCWKDSVKGHLKKKSEKNCQIFTENNWKYTFSW